jgi:hypothetical protein
MRDNQRINQLEEYLADEYAVYVDSMKDSGYKPLDYDDWESGTDYLSKTKEELKKLYEVKND